MHEISNQNRNMFFMFPICVLCCAHHTILDLIISINSDVLKYLKLFLQAMSVTLNKYLTYLLIIMFFVT
jgi:hypothetical protein